MHQGTEKTRSKTSAQLLPEVDAVTRLHKIAMLSVSETSLQPILDEILETALAMSGADFGNIQLLDPVSSDLRIVSQRGFPRWWLDFWESFSKGQGAGGTAHERGERVIIEDVEQTILADTPGLEIQRKAGVRAFQSTPLISRSGKPLGMFSTHYKNPHRPDQRTLLLLDLLARLAADAIEHTQVSSLRQNEERYRLLAEQVTDRIFVIDSHGRYLDANRAGCEMLGYKLEELRALSVPDVITPDELQKLPAQFEDLAAGRITQNEWCFRRKDGSVFIGELLSRQFPDGRLSGIVRDVTERKRTEAEAQAIVESAPVAIFFARDAQCLEIIGNSMAHELLRLPPGSNLSMSAPEGQKPDIFRIMKQGTEIPLHDLPMQKAAATGEAVYGSEIDFVYQDGRCCSLIGNAVPLFGSDGRPQGSIGIFLDITDRKRTDEALRVSEERFRVALKNSSVVVFNQDLELRYTWINSPVLGWAVQGYVGHTDAEIVGGEEGARLMAIKLSVLQSGLGTRTETTVTFQDATHYFDLTVEPLRDATGVIAGVTCSAADITPLKKAALELERLDQLKTEFLGMAAHDLRTPICRILSLSRFLSDEVAAILTEEQLGFLSDIWSSSQVTLQWIDNCLETSAIESGNFHLDLRPTDVRQLLERNIRLSTELAQQQHIHVGLQIEGALPELWLDKGKIEQVLNNLISNAIKFSPYGAAVEVRVRTQDGGVLIAIRDQGPGIPKGERERLFQPFGRTSVRSIMAERSTGLGLAIARKIVEGHGGYIWVESDVGVGSTFFFILPA